MTIVYPFSDHSQRSMHYALTMELPLGKVTITAEIPSSCMAKKGNIPKEICFLLRHPCAESRMKLHIRYGVFPKYTYEQAFEEMAV